jgi:hypothetical protein
MPRHTPKPPEGVELRGLNGAAVARDNTFAAPAYRLEFEARLLPANWRSTYINALDWEQSDPKRGVYVSLHRDDETFLRRQNGQVVIVVHVPRDPEDLDGGGWRWAAVLCDEEWFAMNTPRHVRRFHTWTGMPARMGRSRRVLCASERLDRTWHVDDLDEARDDAWRWFRELEDIDQAFQREVPMSPDVLYRAAIHAEAEGAANLVEIVSLTVADYDGYGRTDD